MTNQADEFLNLSRQLDAMLASDESLQAALNSDNPLLRAAARLTNNSHPILPVPVRQAIWSNMLRVMPRGSASPANMLRPNFMAWAARIAAIFIVAIFVGLAAQPASANSLPGDFLYPVKLGFEQLQLSFANSPQAQVETYLNHAQERLLEIEQLAPDSRYLDETLEAAAESLLSASAIATENDIFGQDSPASQQAQTLAANFEQILASNALTGDLVATVQSTVELVRAQLPNSSTNEELVTPELTPEATVLVIETTAEATLEITPEATPEMTSEATPDSSESLEVVTMYIYPDGAVNVRSGAGTNFDVVGRANQNTPVTVLAQNAAGDWVQVRLPNGLVGWVWIELLDNTPGHSDNSNGNANGNSNGNATGNANDNATGNANGNSNGNANGNSNGRGN